MKKKIFFYYLILTVIGVSITGFFTSQLTQTFYKLEVKENLRNAATLINYQISNDISRGIKFDYDEAAKVYSRILNQASQLNSKDSRNYSRVTFINFDGRVLGESQADYQSMENHADRKEVLEAIEGKIGEDIRFSKTLQVNLVYVAVPIKDAQVIVRVSLPMVQMKKIDMIIWNYTIIGILAGLVLTTILALRFSLWVTHPINELISLSREIAKGNYSKHVAVKSNDEFGQLANTFNEMAYKLEKTVADLVDKNVKVDSIMNSMINGIVAVDQEYRIMLINSMACEMFGIENTPEIIGSNILEVIRHHQINILLKETIGTNTSQINEIIIGKPDDKVLRIFTNPIKSKDKFSINSGGIIFIQDITNVKKLEQIRTEFVSNVTHELKTPLTSIRGFIETLRSGAINDKEVSDKFLEIIDIEAERLYMLINDILQLSEIESKQKDTNIGTHNLKSVIDETISILQGVAERKEVTLSCEVDETLKIVANRDRIKQMLINLIENGIKYNYKNGGVHVKAVREEGKITISVADTGIGIADEHLPRIFERFYRVDKGRSRNMGGTGLGLSIVKHIVNLYNGDIKVSSEFGKGTTFIIRLPA